jgi:signal transduction histidine kinase
MSRTAIRHVGQSRSQVPGVRHDLLPPSLRRFVANPIVQDSLIAVALTAIAAVGIVTRTHVDIPEGGGDHLRRTLDALGIVLLLLQTATLIWRRRSPVLVLGVVTVSLFAFSMLGYFRSFASFGFLIALYTVAAHRERRVSIPAGITCAIVVLLILSLGHEEIEPDTVLVECLIVAAAWFIGDGYRIRRGQFLQLEERATRLERAGKEIARHAVVEERRVIARELHDVVAHNVSVIVAEAAGARRISETHPAEALGTLAPIERTGREALVEMRRLMGFLRTEAEHPSRSPQPGLDDLGTLVDQARRAGLSASIRIEGEPRPVSPGLDLSAYRIVQEGLTNALKHAGPADVSVVVRYESDRLVLIVDDDGVGPSGDRGDPTRPRYGHLGMRERVGLFGGGLQVGSRPGGGYRVIASLPLDAELV